MRHLALARVPPCDGERCRRGPRNLFPTVLEAVVRGAPPIPTESPPTGVSSSGEPKGGQEMNMTCWGRWSRTVTSHGGETLHGAPQATLSPCGSWSATPPPLRNPAARTCRQIGRGSPAPRGRPRRAGLDRPGRASSPSAQSMTSRSNRWGDGAMGRWRITLAALGPLLEHRVCGGPGTQAAPGTWLNCQPCSARQRPARNTFPSVRPNSTAMIRSP